MSHAILLKPSSNATSFFLNPQSQSFEFKARYDSNILLQSPSTSSGKIVYDWTLDRFSLIENNKGHLGIAKPTSIYITKQLHQYKGVSHGYELTIEHLNSQGNRKIFFVFFLQLREGGKLTELDTLLEKKSTEFSLQSFVQNAWKGNNSYYKTTTKDHVFVFPTIIPVSSKKIFEMTGTPTPATQIYREVFLQGEMLDTTFNTAEKARERTVVPESQDIVIVPYNKPKAKKQKKEKDTVTEGFFADLTVNDKDTNNPMGAVIQIDDTDAEMNCYAINDAEGEIEYENYIFSYTGMQDGSYMFAYFLIFLFILPVAYMFCISAFQSDPNYIWGYMIFHLLLAGVMISCGIASAAMVNPKGEKKKQKFNLSFVSLIFLLFWLSIHLIGMSMLSEVINIGELMQWEKAEDNTNIPLLGLSLLLSPFINIKQK